jgi:hypothetical protein
MKYAVEMGSGATIYMPIRTGLGVNRGDKADIYRQNGDGVSLL